MANTKFLDYNGLSKLVEKIKNTYVNKNEQYEGNLKWGGRNFADSFGPIDAAMIPELGANRFAFGNPRGITIEYSNDGGSTWHDYGASDTNKGRLLSDGYPFIIGKVKSSTPANDMLRITIDTSTKTGINCYTALNKFVIMIGTQGSVGCYCTIQKALQSTPTKFLNVVSKVNINGWTGYNVINVPTIITYGNTENSQYGRLRFIFGSTGNDTSYDGLAIHKIYAFGGVGWITPSNMAKYGKLYSYDESQNATFPANVTATKFIGTLQGNANSASKLGTSTIGNSATPIYLNSGTPTACSHSLNANVPANAKFTDTTYNIYQYPRTPNSFWVTENDNSDTAQEIVINDVEHALKADSLNVNDTPIGDNTTPVYINSSGKPTAINYSINANVPSGAKFTDTTYTDLKGATASANGTHGLVPAPTSKDRGKFLKGDGTWDTPTASVSTLSQDDVENILGGSTSRYDGLLSGDGLKIVVDALKTLMGTVEIPYDSVEIMNFSGSAERVAIKMSNEFAQTQFFDNLYNMKFIKFADGCVFTRIGLTLNWGLPVFKGAVVDRMQGIDNMVAWISTDDSNTYLIFDDANNTAISGFLDDSYTPTPLQIKLTWDN